MSYYVNYALGLDIWDYIPDNWCMAAKKVKAKASQKPISNLIRDFRRPNGTLMPGHPALPGCGPKRKPSTLWQDQIEVERLKYAGEVLVKLRDLALAPAADIAAIREYLNRLFGQAPQYIDTHISGQVDTRSLIVNLLGNPQTASALLSIERALESRASKPSDQVE